jgi:hypothetical protein
MTQEEFEDLKKVLLEAAQAWFSPYMLRRLSYFLDNVKPKTKEKV